MTDNVQTDSWTCIRVETDSAHLDTVSAILSMIDNGLLIEDYSDVEKDLDGVYGDLIDEELLKKDRTRGAVSVYVPEGRSPHEAEMFVRDRLNYAGIDAEITLSGVSEADWADSWKKYYKPIKTGRKLVIVPEWETYDAKPGELTVLMDPGMAFGTGTHETTRLCASMLEDFVRPGCSLLDVGCGSGILSICAVKLGARKAFACDIDPTAVRIARENAGLNGTPEVVCAVSDLLRDVPDERYDVIASNIVADVILRMLPDVGAHLAPEGVWIFSGVIEERAEEVVSALRGAGYRLISEKRENGWYAGAAKKN